MTAPTPAPESTPESASDDAAAAAPVADVMDKVIALASEAYADASGTLDRPEVNAVAIALADTLASIESGETTATPAERGFVTGALHALRGVLMADQTA